MLSQCILLKIHQYRVWFIHKPGPKIFIADWLSRHNHKEGKDKTTKDMDTMIDAMQSMTDNPEFMSISQIQQTSVQDEHLQCLNSFIIAGWPNVNDELHSTLRLYWSYRDDLAVIYEVVMKGRQIIIPTALNNKC